jgi:GT2 family glycosyltransferase
MYRYEQLQKPEGYRPLVVGGTSVDMARNELVRAFLAIPEASHLLFLDDDVLPPEDAIPRLMAHDLPIVSGLYFKRGAPYVPVAWRFARGKRVNDGARGGTEPLLDYRPGLQEVAAVGAGLLLIRREVLENIPEPWFATHYPVCSEDAYFCELARAAGFKVYLDADVKAGHLSVSIITEAHYLRERRLEEIDHKGRVFH